ncbi:MAG: bifunctional riboflavin kinase/FAD synthetase [Gammaproteobacteria bacterium]|nr:bifunctional riboflavin kinase/FAD synthetase [Gammaproteobacteria bacterium]
MELIRGRINLKPRHRGCAASIGNYDGVHLGHRHVLEQLVSHARAHALPATLVVFEPMPQEYFAAGAPPARLMAFTDKLPVLAEFGVERVVCLHFNRSLAGMPAEEFIERVLERELGVRQLVVGEDFRFGHGRRGDMKLLRAAGPAHGFEVAPASTLMVAGGRVSSSRIRECLAAGELESAARLLGSPFSICGRVVRGRRWGHELGYPTANIPLKRRVSPVHGIFVAAVHGIGGTTRHAAAYVGGGSSGHGQNGVLEVHLLGFKGELYGQRLRVELLHQLRADARFHNLEALRAQMSRDMEAANAWLKNHGLH